ncbi:MAG: tripartite tricarboxylate transporter permease, partial [Treponema sp.]|nr:tripartite tricarboxylate transporter permease [Treponema sp.]
MNLELIVSAIVQVFHPQNILFIFSGAIGGVLVGCIPGLTSTMGIALLIPFTYGLSIIPS